MTAEDPASTRRTLASEHPTRRARARFEGLFLGSGGCRWGESIASRGIVAGSDAQVRGVPNLSGRLGFWLVAGV